jgi:hypothetical protein
VTACGNSHSWPPAFPACSQPLPPDTPEHASALLLFLAAALRQVEQECQPPSCRPSASSWQLNPSLSNCKSLLDFYACPRVQDLLGQLLPQQAGAPSPNPLTDSSTSIAARAWRDVLNTRQQQQDIEAVAAETMRAFSQVLLDCVEDFVQKVTQNPALAAAAAAQGNHGKLSQWAGHFVDNVAVLSGAAALSLLVSSCAASSSSSSDGDSSGSSSSSSFGAATSTLAVQMALVVTEIEALPDKLVHILQAAASAWHQQQQQLGQPALQPQLGSRRGLGQRQRQLLTPADLQQRITDHILSEVRPEPCADMSAAGCVCKSQTHPLFAHHKLSLSQLWFLHDNVLSAWPHTRHQHQGH